MVEPVLEPDTVRVERDGPATPAVIERPAARDPIEQPTAAAPAKALPAFEHDADAAAGVLWRAGGTFRAGADLWQRPARGAAAP